MMRSQGLSFFLVLSCETYSRYCLLDLVELASSPSITAGLTTVELECDPL